MSDTASQFTVLVVDDEPINIDLIKNTLQPAFQIKAAINAQVALKMLDKIPPPDLILLDVMMPDMDGYELCEKIKANQATQHIDIIFVSAKDDLDSILKGYSLGAIDYLTKPIQPDELLQKVKLNQSAKVQNSDLQTCISAAEETAYTAMTSLGEQGIVLNFLRTSFGIHCAQELAEKSVGCAEQYGLTCSIQLRLSGEEINASTKEDISPLEKSLLNKLKNAGRLREKDDYFVANYGDITLLVQNMPRQEELRGRLRDHLAVLIETANSRLQYLELENKLNRLIDDSKDSLATVKKMQTSSQNFSVDITQQMLDSLESSFLSYGLEEQQEETLLSFVRESTDKLLDHYDSGMAIDKEFEAIVARLESCAVKKEVTSQDDDFFDLFI